MIAFDNGIELEEKDIDILTIGDLLVDMISSEYDDHAACDTYNRYFGGSPSNIAMNAHKLGIRSLVASAVGNDGMGKFLMNHLHTAGIDTRCIQQVDHSTSMVVVTKSKSSPIPIFYRGADYHLQFNPMLQESVMNSRIIHFSCWPISRNPARSTIERVIEEAKKHNILIGFDPNYHPMIWQSGEDGVDYVKSIIRHADIVKPSEDDAERLFGADTYENQIEKFLELGAKLVILTLGAEGAIASNGVETVTFRTYADEVVDTTGAGDAFWSGFYSALVKQYTVKEAMELGFAVSAHKLKYTGAVVELPRLEQIKASYGL